MAMKVCLVMIVKQEAEGIRQSLDTIKSFIDAWCIVDTGSTDGTQDIIREHMKDVPGVLLERPWVDFGTNRTEGIREAEAWLQGRPGWEDDGYFFWLDADDRFEPGPGFKWPEFEGADGRQADAFAMKVQNTNMAHVRVHLFRAFQDWCFHGPIHEYPYPKDTSKKLLIAPMNGCQYRCMDPVEPRPKERFEEDIRILKAHLKAHPNDPRTLFYLGQSYFDMGDYKNSLNWYASRADAGAWPEEQWYAQYRVLTCAHLLKLPMDTIMHEGLKAFAMRPSRAEPLHLLARIMRKDPRALPFALAAAALPPTNDSLFVETRIYEWAAVDEACTAASWAGQYAMAMNFAEATLKKCPKEEFHRIYNNMAMFATKMAGG